MSNIYHKHKFE